MVSFDWISPQRILFGAGRFSELSAIAAAYGDRVTLITGARSLAASGRLASLTATLSVRNIQYQHLTIEHEPTAEAIDALAASAREFNPNVIAAVGGGSAIDTGKAVAALLANGGETLDYLEGVGRGRQLLKPSLPMIAVPTTAGTGSEATKNAVIGDEARTYKKSMRSDGMMPAVAVVDPELTYGSPLNVSAACGMDALTQLLEAYTSRRANPFSDAFAQQGIDGARALTRLPHMQNEAPVRGMLSMASLVGGICLANVGLGAVHGIVSPLGAFHPVPHGAGCAALLPATVRVNARRAAEKENEALMGLQKYGIVYEFLTNDPMPAEPLGGALKLADWLADLNHALELPGLAHYGLTSADFPRIVAGSRGNSMKTNMVDLTDEDLFEILESSL